MTALHATPRLRDIALEQIRAVALVLRAPALGALTLGGIATLLFVVEMVREGERIAFHPERWLLPAIAGLLLPVLIWKGQERSGSGFLWTLPVDRYQHALAKVFAGWVWLIGGVAFFVLWLFVLALVSGGNVLAEETLSLATFDAGAVQTVRWTPRPLLWLVPFTSATAMYLVATAIALGTRHLLRWVIVFVLAFLLVATIADVAKIHSLRFVPSRAVAAFLYGSYGLSRLVTANADFVAVRATLANGESVRLAPGIPDLARWAAATLIWSGAGLIAVWAAASRQRERRRP
jgi:hypothetical protein